jgi:hypothetical protein
VREAAGRATSTEGDEDFLSTGTIIVPNGLRHRQILRVLREGDAAPLPQQQSHTHPPYPSSMAYRSPIVNPRVARRSPMALGAAHNQMVKQEVWQFASEW